METKLGRGVRGPSFIIRVGLGTDTVVFVGSSECVGVMGLDIGPDADVGAGVLLINYLSYNSSQNIPILMTLLLVL